MDNCEVPEVDIVINGEDYPLSCEFETYVMGRVSNKYKKNIRRSERLHDEIGATRN